MEFFHLIKATQKSGKEDAVIWFTAKSEARANLQLDVELEDAGIETGRGKDYSKPVRTDFPVYNDLPEESTVDYTWCKRYELQDDGRTWLPKAKESGSVATDLVFTNKSWRAFRLDTTIKDNAITFPALSPFGNQINAGPQAMKGAIYKGRWGNFDLWLYNDWFIDPLDNVEKPMIPDGAVIMSGADLMGTRAFGVILDPAFNYGPLAYAPKSWVKEDPAQRLILMQSSPLVIPSRVNASLCAVMDDAIPLDDALLQLNEFIGENAVNGPDSVQVWGNGATYDNVLLEASYDRTGIPCPWKFWNNRDVRTIVELGKAVGCKPRYEIPFEGEPHKAISDAHHQIKYVSAIWQRLTEH